MITTLTPGQVQHGQDRLSALWGDPDFYNAPLRAALAAWPGYWVVGESDLAGLRAFVLVSRTEQRCLLVHLDVDGDVRTVGDVGWDRLRDAFTRSRAGTLSDLLAWSLTARDADLRLASAAALVAAWESRPHRVGDLPTAVLDAAVDALAVHHRGVLAIRARADVEDLLDDQMPAATVQPGARERVVAAATARVLAWVDEVPARDLAPHLREAHWVARDEVILDALAAPAAGK